MSYIDDTCDFCGSRFDPMGDPILHNTRKGLWDGCREGRDALFAHVSTQRVAELLAESKESYFADPTGSPRRLSRYDLDLLIKTLKSVLRDRETGEEK